MTGLYHPNFGPPGRPQKADLSGGIVFDGAAATELSLEILSSRKRATGSVLHVVRLDR